MNGDFNPTCGNCKFYKPTIGRPSEGLCRRFPPVVIPLPLPPPNPPVAPVAVMPNMQDSNWCGEWKGKHLI